MPFDDVKAYHTYIRGIANKADLIAESYKIKINPKSGHISAEGFAFDDGGILSFFELVQVQSREIYRLEYAYDYQKNGFFFRYEKDPKRAKGFIHPECHLHVNGHDEIRYLTHEVSFEEVFYFIVENNKAGKF